MMISKAICSLINNPRQFLVTFITINLLTFSGLAQSNFVYTQLPLNGGNGSASFVNDESADNFILTRNAYISGIHWEGSFYDPSRSSDLFTIRFFMDNGSDLPFDNHFQEFNVEASRSLTGLSNSSSGDPGDIDPRVFLFTASLTPFQLFANTTYYVSIVHPEDNILDEFYWLQNDKVSSSFSRDTDKSSSWALNEPAVGNFAFRIVPEPNSIILFALAFLGLFIYRRSIKI